MSSSHGSYLSQRTFSALDGLRGFSILGVVWHHSDLPVLVHEALPAARFGFLGVDLFFTISGFLIVTLLLRERDRTGRISLRRFYVRRSMRILPLYYGVLVVLAVWFLLLNPGTTSAELFAADFPLLVAYLTNWIPAYGWLAITWSLAAEEQFYVVWPPVEKWLRRWALALLVAVVVVSQVIQLGLVDAALERAFGWSAGEPPMLREITFTPICLGVLLAHVLHRPEGWRRVARLLGARWVAPALFVAVVVYANLLPADIRGGWRLGMHLVLLLLLAACVVREDHGLRRLLTWRPLARIGAISYGIYVFHLIFMTVAHQGLGALGISHPVNDFIAALGLVVLVADLSHRHYESRFLRLKRAFA